MHTSFISYDDGGTLLEGFLATPDQNKHPLVLLCHAWAGRDAFICEKAKAIAQWGYTAFAIDMYGKDVLGKSKEENHALKQPFLNDRALLQKRILKAYEVACAQPFVDATQIIALGFGFGAICALDLARSGVDLCGAISVYGHFIPPPHPQPIKAKILILHGADDPITPLHELHAFEKELTQSQVDWQTHIFGHAKHAFATPSANDSLSGLLYDPLGAQRAWNLIHQFCDEIFN